MTLNRNIVSQTNNHVIILQTMMLVICFSAPLPFGCCALGFLFLPLTFHNWPSCHRKCIDVLIISSTGNTQTSILLLCFLYLFVEFTVTCFLYLFVDFMVTCFLYLFVDFMVTMYENIWFKPTGIRSGFPSGLPRRDTADAEIIDRHLC